MMKPKGLTEENTYGHKILLICLRPPKFLKSIQGITVMVVMVVEGTEGLPFL